MAICNYILKLPGGKTIELPAGFNSLDESDVINSLFSEIKTEPDEAKKDSKLSELTALIKSKVPAEIHGTKINNIISKATNSDEVYQKINDLIAEFGTYKDIGTAVMNYIKKDTKKGGANKKVEELKSWLLAPRDSHYFKDFGISGIIGATNIKQEKTRIYTKNLINEEFGFTTEITENLHTLLSTLNSKYFAENKTNFIYGVTDPFIGKAWSTDEYVIYETDDDLSLFLGLFKREAVKINQEELIPILEKINAILKTKKNGKFDIDAETFSIEEFFKGKLTDRKIAVSKFEELLELAVNPEIAKQIDAIITLVAKTINPNKVGLSKAIKSLFWQLKPNFYGKDILLKQYADLNYTSDEAKLEQEYKRNQLSFTDMDSQQRDLFYAPKETIKDPTYEKVIKSIAIHKDIVKFPNEGQYGVYALVTHIYDRGEDGVAIYGTFKNQLNEFEDVKFTFNKNEIVFKRRENAKDPEILNELVEKQEGALIRSDVDLPHKVVKELIRKGDTVSGDVVLGIYPNHIVTRKQNGDKNIVYYSHIKSLSSVNLLQQINNEINSPKEDYRGYIDIKNGEDLTAGDLFWFETDKAKFYKRILFTTDTQVYSWVETADHKYIIKGTARTGLVGKRDSSDRLNADEISLEMSHIGSSKATMSSFSDQTKAYSGDVFSYIDEGIKKYGKVLEDDKIVLHNDTDITQRIVSSMNFFKENTTLVPTFFTTRDISSNYAFFTNRINSWELEFKIEADDELDDELEYVVPIGVNLDLLLTLPHGYGSIGTYKTKSSVNPNEDLVITKELLETLGKPAGSKVFAKKVSSTSILYKRNLTSVVPMHYFNTLSPETKMDLNVIIPGSYFSLYKNGEQIDRNIYRILSVKGDRVIAQLNKLSSSGKIITNEIELSLEQIIQSKVGNTPSPIGSIANLYLQTGNTKISAVFDETNKLYSQEDTEGRPGTNKAIGILISKFKGYVKGLGIQIKVVPHTDIFTAGQYAALQTEVVAATDLKPESTKTSIVISDQLGETTDVIHEFLHVFLTPLRYRHPEIYNAFIQSVVNDTSLNVTDAEEEFVKFVSTKVARKEDFAEYFENMQTFVEGLRTIITDVDPEYAITDEENPVELLKTPLSELFNIDKKDESHPMFNLGLITTEPQMREWMKANNITLNCT